MSSKTATRDPKAAPFKIGTRLKYVGTRETWACDDNGNATVRIIGPGLEVVIDETMPGHRGSGEQLRDSDGPMYDDAGEAILDETQDAVSVYHIEDKTGKRHGRLIHREARSEWTVLSR
jgi:hypothetical protein